MTKQYLDLDALPDSALLDEKTAADALHSKPATLSVWRTTGRVHLPYVKIGSRVRYKVGDLKAFIARRTRGAEPGDAEEATPASPPQSSPKPQKPAKRTRKPVAQPNGKPGASSSQRRASRRT